jgi:hypothetical protein
LCFQCPEEKGREQGTATLEVGGENEEDTFLHHYSSATEAETIVLLL